MKDVEQSFHYDYKNEKIYIPKFIRYESNDMLFKYYISKQMSKNEKYNSF